MLCGCGSGDSGCSECGCCRTCAGEEGDIGGKSSKYTKKSQITIYFFYRKSQKTNRQFKILMSRSKEIIGIFSKDF